MPKYEATIVEQVTSVIIVEAKDQEEAELKADKGDGKYTDTDSDGGVIEDIVEVSDQDE